LATRQARDSMGSEPIRDAIDLRPNEGVAIELRGDKPVP
jgi:hypothetical protein